MQRLLGILMGLCLIGLGTLALALNLLAPALGKVFFGVWRLWPLSLTLLSLFFLLPPLLRYRRGLGGLLLPGTILLATSGLLLAASVLDRWQIWARFWPVEVLAVAAGFSLMALYMRNMWIVIPALLIGLNGSALQFCALTGWWSAWGVLWTVEPFAVGLILLLTAFKTRALPVFIVGVAFCFISIAAALAMLALFTGLGKIAGFVLALGFICLGLALMAWNFLPARPRPAPAPAA